MMKGQALVRGRGRLLLLLALSALVSSCVRADLGQALQEIGETPVAAGFEEARREPLNARSHMQAARHLLGRANRTQADIQLARSGFQTAARLAPDMWEPKVGLAAAHYRLGEYGEALQAMAEAVELRGDPGPLALPLALLAFRAQEPELARLAFTRAAQSDSDGAAFLSRAFSGPAIWVPRPQQAPRRLTVSSEEERNVVIEAFLIRD